MLMSVNTPKQKLKIAILLIILAVLAWQLYGLFFPGGGESGSTANTSPAKLIAKNSVTPKAGSSAVPLNVTMPPAAPSQAGLSAAQQPATPAGTTPNSTNASPDLGVDPAQRKYLRLLQQYKLLELEKSIAADKQAIVASELSTMEAINKLNSMGGQAQAMNLLGEDEDGASASSANNADAKEKVFSLQYTGLEDGEWVATIKYGNSVYDVKIGTLVAGKYKVTRINNDNVILNSPTDILTLTFNGVNVVQKTPVAEPINPIPQPAPQQPKPVQPVVANGGTRQELLAQTPKEHPASHEMPPVPQMHQAAPKAPIAVPAHSVEVQKPVQKLAQKTEASADASVKLRTEKAAHILVKQEDALMHPKANTISVPPVAAPVAASHPVQTVVTKIEKPVPAVAVKEKNLAPEAKTQGTFLLQEETKPQTVNPTKPHETSASTQPAPVSTKQVVKVIAEHSTVVPPTTPKTDIPHTQPKKSSEDTADLGLPMLETSETIVPTPELPQKPAALPASAPVASTILAAPKKATHASTPEAQKASPVQVLATMGGSNNNTHAQTNSANAPQTDPTNSVKSYWVKFKGWLSGEGADTN